MTVRAWIARPRHEVLPPVGRRVPVVPAEAGAGRALTAVVAILTFLAALVAGLAETGRTSAAAWTAALAREATVQVRPVAGRDIEADVLRVVEVAREARGVAAVRPLPPADAERLLEPWLGSGLDLSELPVPRLVVLVLDLDLRPDLDALAGRLKAAVPVASLDTHALWLAQLSRIARIGMAAAAALVLLVLAAAGGATGFAIRGTLAGHRDLVEVLHLTGAEDAFIGRVFAARFGRLGLTGGLIGAFAAALALWLIGRLSDPVGPAEREAALPSWGLSIGWTSYLAALAVALAVGALAALVAAASVKRFLKAGRKV